MNGRRMNKENNPELAEELDLFDDMINALVRTPRGGGNTTAQGMGAENKATIKKESKTSKPQGG